LLEAMVGGNIRTIEVRILLPRLRERRLVDPREGATTS
jgi:hypothetical protein